MTMEQLMFEGVSYMLNQCEDIWKWFKESKVGEYTRYYSNTIFHTEDGFCAAPSSDLTNWCYV